MSSPLSLRAPRRTLALTHLGEVLIAEIFNPSPAVRAALEAVRRRSTSWSGGLLCFDYFAEWLA